MALDSSYDPTFDTNDPYADPYGRPYQLPQTLSPSALTMPSTAGLTPPPYSIGFAQPSQVIQGPFAAPTAIPTDAAGTHAAGTPNPSVLGSIPYTGNPQTYVQSLIQALHLKGAQANPAALQQIVDALKGRGVNASLDTRTDGLHKGIMLDGQFVKLLDGQDNWTWLPGGNTDSGADTPTSIDPSYLSPFTQPFLLPNGSALSPFPGFKDFVAPTADTVRNSESFKARLKTGEDQVQASAAAKGLLNSGGTLYDVLGLGQNLASQEYDNEFNRQFGVWDASNKNLASAYGLNYNTANSIYGRGQQEWLNARDTFYKNQQNPFDKLFSTAELGRNAVVP